MKKSAAHSMGGTGTETTVTNRIQLFRFWN